MNDYYATLEVSPLASDEEIKKAYRRLVLKYHPDRNQGNTRAVRKMQGINTAFEVLSDPEKRKAYDLEHRFDSQGVATETQPSPTTEADQEDAEVQHWLNSIKDIKDRPHESGEWRSKWEKEEARKKPWGSLAFYLLFIFVVFLALELQLSEDLTLLIWGALAYLFVWLWVKFIE